MAMTYQDIILKVRKQIALMAGGSYFLTPAVVKVSNGHKCEVYFVYHIPASGKMIRPHMRVVSDFETGTVLEFRNAFYSEFADAEKYPLGSPMNPQVPVAKSAGEQKELIGKLQSSYEKVRQIAFSEDISQDAIKELEEYRKCLADALPTELLAFCEQTEPSFFEWMNHVIGEHGKD